MWSLSYKRKIKINKIRLKNLFKKMKDLRNQLRKTQFKRKKSLKIWNKYKTKKVLKKKNQQRNKKKLSNIT